MATKITLKRKKRYARWAPAERKEVLRRLKALPRTKRWSFLEKLGITYSHVWYWKQI